MFRQRQQISKKLSHNMVKAKERRRLEGLPPDYPQPLPELRRRVIIIDYDFGKTVQVMNLYKTDRVDCYKAVADGVVWKERVGWAKVMEGIRKSFIRVGASA